MNEEVNSMINIVRGAATKKVTIALGALLLLATAPNKHQVTCEEECLTHCSANSHRQFVCQQECFARCHSQRSTKKSEDR